MIREIARTLSTHGIIWYAAAIHLWWGITIISTPPAGTDWNGGVMWNVYIELIGLEFWGWTMIAVALLSIASMLLTSQRSLTALLLVLPQQITLAVGAFGAVAHAFGYYEPFAISRILRVFPWTVGLFVLHTFSLLTFHDLTRQRDETS